MAAAFRMLNQSFDLFGRCGTLQGYRERDAFECRPGAVQTEFIRDVERATDIDLAFLDGNVVEMREPRNLGKQSKSRAHKKIRERRRGEIGSAALFRFVAF
jgi:hypothetical protein